MFGKTKLQGRKAYRMMSIASALSFGLYGYDAGVLGGVQGTKPFLDAIGNPTDSLTIPWVASAYVLAATFASLAVMWIGFRIGRRGCLLVGNGSIIIGTAIQASAMSLPHILVGRVICGWGIGFISCTVPTYMAEMSIESKERGPEVAKQCAYLISGIAFAYWLDFGFTRMDNQVSWRFPIAFQAVFAIGSLSLLMFLPDTPRWYYARKRTIDGDRVLCQLHDKPLEHPDVVAQKEEILASIRLEEEDTSKFNLISLVWDNSDLRAGRRIRIAFCLLAIQQMMGINLTVFYATTIFANMGLSPFLSQILAAVMNTVYAGATWILPFTIERFGRRPILIWSAVGCTISMLVFVVMLGLPHQTKGTQWTAVVGVISFNFFLGYGWVGVAWLYGAEIAPLKYRHIGAASSAFGEWLFSFITVFAGGIALTNVGWKIWIWQLLSCILAIFFAYFMCPETGGKTLEEIDYIFIKNPEAHRANVLSYSSDNMGKSDEAAVSMDEKV